MGGSAGHMKNVWEARNLTFQDLKSITEKSLKGELKNITEKLDGQNLMATWKDGDIRIARNKTHLKNFGENSLSITGIENKYEDRGSIKDAFVYAAKDLKNTLEKSLIDPSVFFNNGEIWMNLEILYTKTENVINYGKEQLRIHHLRKIDTEGNTLEIIDGKNFKSFTDEIEKTQSEFSMFQGNNVFKVLKTNNVIIIRDKDWQQKIEEYHKYIDEIKDSCDLKDDDTIQDYIDSSIIKFLLINFPNIDKELNNALVKRWGHEIKQPPINKLLKDVDDETAKLIRSNDKQMKYVIKHFTSFIEDIFLKLGGEVLNNLDGLASFKQSLSKEIVKSKVEEAIEKIENDIKNNAIDSNKEQIFIENKHKLEKGGGINYIAPTEGIVFSYKGELLKLTGMFGPVNQIVGFYRYER